MPLMASITIGRHEAAPFHRLHKLTRARARAQYPGYVFGRGYDTPANVEAAFAALRDLIRETRAALPSPRSVTMGALCMPRKSSPSF